MATYKATAKALEKGISNGVWKIGKFTRHDGRVLPDATQKQLEEYYNHNPLSGMVELVEVKEKEEKQAKP